MQYQNSCPSLGVMVVAEMTKLCSPFAPSSSEFAHVVQILLWKYYWAERKICFRLFCPLRAHSCLKIWHSVNLHCTITNSRLRMARHYTFTNQLGQGVLRHSTIVNLTDIELTNTQKDVLCRGLNLAIPPQLSSEGIVAKFELCWQQLENYGTTAPWWQEYRATLAQICKLQDW